MFRDFFSSTDDFFEKNDMLAEDIKKLKKRKNEVQKVQKFEDTAKSFVHFRPVDMELRKDHSNLVTFISPENVQYGLNFSIETEADNFFSRFCELQSGKFKSLNRKLPTVLLKNCSPDV